MTGKRQRPKARVDKRSTKRGKWVESAPQTFKQLAANMIEILQERTA